MVAAESLSRDTAAQGALIVTRGTARKDPYALSLEGSGLRYEPRDSLAIIPENDPELVAGLLAQLAMHGSEEARGCNLRTVLQRVVTITKPGAGNRRRAVPRVS